MRHLDNDGNDDDDDALTFLTVTLPNALSVRAGDEYSDEERFLLHGAIALGHEDRVVQLVQSAPHCVHEYDLISGHTALHVAAATGNLAIAVLLVQTGGALVDAATHQGGVTPLMLASRFGHQELVAFLVEYGAAVAQPNYNSSYSNNTATTTTTTPLSAAALSGRVDIVQYLLSRGAPVDARNQDGSTPLMVAAAFANLGVVQVLLDARADVCALDACGRSAVYLAALYGHLGVLQVLLATAARQQPHKSSHGSTMTPLMAAARRGHAQVVELLLLTEPQGAVDDRQEPTNNRTALHVACFYGHDQVVRVLLEKGANVYTKLASNGKTALHLAAQQGHAAVVDLLLQRGALVDARTVSGFTSLHFAVQNGHTEIVSKLLGDGKAHVEARTEDGRRWTPLMLAVAGGHGAMVDWLLCNKAQVNTVSDQDDHGQDQYSALHVAVQQGDPEIVWALLRHGADVSVRATHGRTCLHLAAAATVNGHAIAKLIDLLVAHGADLRATTEDGLSFTPLHTAAQHGKLDAFVHLQTRTFDTQQPQQQDWEMPTELRGWTLLYVAAKYGQDSIVQYLLKQCDSIEIDAIAEGEDRSTPLFVAAQGGYAEIVQRLLERGANVDATTVDGRSPLAAAAQNGHCHVVHQLLLMAPARQGSPGSAGARATALLAACEHGNYDVVALLCRYGVDATTCHPPTSRGGASTVFLAAQGGHDKILALLLQQRGAHAMVNVPRASDGATPLHAATQNGQLASMKMLLSYGGNVHATTADAMATPLYYACQYDHSHVLDLLLGAGADPEPRALDGSTPLMIAALEGHLECVQFLCNKVVQVQVNAQRHDGATPLFLAIKHERLEIAQFLLLDGMSHGANVHLGTQDKSTPALVAAQNGYVEILQRLWQRGAMLTVARDGDGATPLYMACAQGHLDVVEFLTQTCGVVYETAMARDQSTGLFAAAQNGHARVVRFLYTQCHASLDTARSDGATPLYVAGANGHFEVVQLLLGYFAVNENGGQLDGISRDSGMAPLHMACLHGHLGIVRALCEAGATTESASASNGETPLGVACRAGHGEIATYLLARWHANTETATTTSGSTPLHGACQHGHDDVVQTLVAHGARTTARRKNEMTPLHVAAHFGHLRIVEMLIDANPGILNATGPKGATAMTMARLQRHDGVCALLQSRGGRE